MPVISIEELLILINGTINGDHNMKIDRVID